ncbi:MAG: hypothetical protein JWQ35_1184 [Bacteriovoracaceae bacterium]|nr:hypothetical protein [Bacteriovoracaceae bacterium]
MLALAISIALISHAPPRCDPPGPAQEMLTAMRAAEEQNRKSGIYHVRVTGMVTIGNDIVALEIAPQEFPGQKWLGEIEKGKTNGMGLMLESVSPATGSAKLKGLDGRTVELFVGRKGSDIPLKFGASADGSRLSSVLLDRQASRDQMIKDFDPIIPPSVPDFIRSGKLVRDLLESLENEAKITPLSDEDFRSLLHSMGQINFFDLNNEVLSEEQIKKNLVTYLHSQGHR